MFSFLIYFYVQIIINVNNFACNADKFYFNLMLPPFNEHKNDQKAAVIDENDSELVFNLNS